MENTANLKWQRGIRAAMRLQRLQRKLGKHEKLKLGKTRKSTKRRHGINFEREPLVQRKGKGYLETSPNALRRNEGGKKDDERKEKQRHYPKRNDTRPNSGAPDIKP